MAPSPDPDKDDTHAGPVSAEPRAAPWQRWVARCGIVAEGLLYLLIGGFALVAAGYPRQKPQGSGGALDQLAAAPLGSVLLLALLSGLASFVAWRLIQATLDPEQQRAQYRVKRWLLRLGYLFSAAAHAVVVGTAAWRLFTVDATSGHGHAAAQWTSWAMQWPLGRWAVGTAGAGIVVFAVVQLYRAVTASVGQRIGLADHQPHPLIVTIGVIGLLARGLVFGLVGALLFYAAWSFSGGTTQGLAAALIAVEKQPAGPWLLGALALGLIDYGVFQFIRARYRRI